MNVHGPNWRKRFVESLPKELAETITTTPVDFNFWGIGGSTKVDTVYTFPVGIFGNNGEIQSAEVEQDIHLLLSRDHQRELGIDILCDDTCNIRYFNVEGAPLLRTAHGHPALSLLDFHPDGHPGVQGQTADDAAVALITISDDEINYHCKKDSNLELDPVSTAHENDEKLVRAGLRAARPFISSHVVVASVRGFSA